MGGAALHRLAHPGDKHIIAYLIGFGIIGQEGQHPPVDEVGTIALGGIFPRQVGRTAQHALAAGRLLPGRTIARLVGIDGAAR